MSSLPYAPFGFAPPAVKRKAFFSFHYDDIMRVNNVRNVWKIDHPDAPNARSFYDSSLWESKKLEGDDAVKRLIREGVQYTSTVCVLIGSDTWSRQWVRYEIARAVIDKRGLLGVHINNIKHHQRLCPCPIGPSPFDFLAVGKVQPLGLYQPAAYYLFELTANGWDRYQDYTQAVSLPPYLSDCVAGMVTPLSRGVPVYDFVVNDGAKNLGGWIDRAAQAVGR